MDSRIRILDSYRAIAILAVISYHYYHRWDELLPYEGLDFFGIGKYGVQFFFVISGFVIHYTLTRKESLLSFYSARLIRLLPTMVIFSTITFLFFKLFPLNIHPRFDNDWGDLLASWTFVEPSLINRIFNTKVTYIDGAYWSLWYEVRLYIWVGIIYFANKRTFLRNWIIFTCLLNIWMYVPRSTFPEIFTINFDSILPVGWINYFTLGVIFYLLYAEEKIRPGLIYTLLLIFVLETIRIRNFAYGNNFLAFNVITGLFLLFTFKMPLPKFFESKIMVKMGRASYGLYLLHQNVGLALIYFTLSAVALPPVLVCLSVV
ncbi:MAG: acyltransferase, partial [Bacteroidota bacterium]